MACYQNYGIKASITDIIVVGNIERPIRKISIARS